jgi:hypothetical protein
MIYGQQMANILTAISIFNASSLHRGVKTYGLLIRDGNIL